MLKTAFIYPGQGVQAIGMGISAVERFPEAASIFDRASESAGYDMRAICADGPMEKLSQTRYTQPALFTVEAAITDVLKTRGIQPDCTAGHSLGEFSAWYAAGVYGFEEGFRLVSERGNLMENADPEGVGTMSAVLGLTHDEVEEVCTGINGTVVVANINSPLQIVISGEKSAVEKAGNILKERGAKRVMPLKVSGAFHSPMMENTRDKFASVVDSISLSDAHIPVYANISAKPVTEVDEIRKAMVQQLVSSVLWTDTVNNFIGDGVCEAFEIGPGNVLGGLAKRIDATLKVISISNASKILEVVDEKN